MFNNVFDSTVVETKSVTVNLTAKSRRKLSATPPEPTLYEVDSSRYPSSHPSTPPKSRKHIWARLFLNSLELPRAYSGARHTGVPLIVDSGASVCITPRREDFIYYRNSKVKIKDLSKTNEVAGEGVVRWKVRDKTGKIVNIDLPGYHIPNAEVRLLSPQVLLSTVGGSSKAIQTPADLIFCLGNGVELQAHYCPRSNLPLLRSICDHAADIRSFWHDTFDIYDEWLDPNDRERNVLARPATQVSEGASNKDATQAPEGARTGDGPAMNTHSQVKANEPQYASFNGSSQDLDEGATWGYVHKRTGACYF